MALARTPELVHRRRPGRTPALFVTLAAAAVAAATLVVVRPWSSDRPEVIRQSPTATPAPAPAAGPSPTAPSPSAAAPAAVPPPTPWHFEYQPMWPFRDEAEAEAWRVSRTKATQPWHASADETAQMFTQSFLGFTGLDLVTSHTGTATDAHVGVGGPTEGTRTSTAAIVHLVRFGPAPDAPWEVVGTDDTTFSLTTPRYGASIRETTSVGGRITGVDESIHVQVRQPSEPSLLGDRCCLAAGGDNRPWSTSVTVHGANEPVVTVVAWTGGHLRAVERFTVTAVRPG